MRIGIFLNRNEPRFRISELISILGNELIGYHSKVPEEKFSKYRYTPNPLELLAGCDTALIFSLEGSLYEIPRAAIRRGVNLFLVDLASYPLSLMNELNTLANEINAVVEFGFSGYDINRYVTKNSTFNKPLFIDCKRNLPLDASFELMQRIIIYDLATMIRLQGGMVKKLRVASFPSSDINYDLLNLRIEYTNGSLFCYTLNRLAQNEAFSLSIYANHSKEMIDICLPVNPLDMNKEYEHSPYSPISFLNSLQQGCHPVFSLPQAIEVNTIFQNVIQKLASYF
jgi:hypothetical protein